VLSSYVQRSLEPVLRRASGEFPAVVLTGPRQSGKTTLLKHLFGVSHEYVALDLPDIRAAAAADPRGFLAMHKPPVIFDEIQYTLMLLPYIREQIDQRRSEHGMFLLTGSQNLALAEQVTETLAGRTAMLQLMPMTQRESVGIPDLPLPWETDEPHQLPAVAHLDLWRTFLRGNYPEVVTEPDRDWSLWHAPICRPTSSEMSDRLDRLAI